MTDHFLGYRRADGRVGVRNFVAILSAMDNTNPSAERNRVNGQRHRGPGQPPSGAGRSARTSR